MGAAVAHRHTEALSRSDCNVRTELAWRREQRQRKRIGRHHRNCATGVESRDGVAVVDDMAVRSRILEDRAEDLCGIQIGFRVSNDELPAKRLGARLEHSDRLRMAVLIDEEAGLVGLRPALRHRHRLSGGCRLVEQRSIRDVQRREVADHRLKVDESLEPPLADLRLVGRIGRVPGRVLQDIALNHGGDLGSVVSLTDQRGEYAVFICNGAKIGECLGLCHRRAKIKFVWVQNRRRHSLGDQLVEGFDSNGPQHLCNIGLGWANVPLRKQIYVSRFTVYPICHCHTLQLLDLLRLICSFRFILPTAKSSQSAQQLQPERPAALPVRASDSRCL